MEYIEEEGTEERKDREKRRRLDRRLDKSTSVMTEGGMTELTKG